MITHFTTNPMISDGISTIHHTVLPIGGHTELIGITPTGGLLVDTLYGEEDARYRVVIENGQITRHQDDLIPDDTPIDVPTGTWVPNACPTLHPFNFNAGGFTRGWRELNRIDSLLYPLEIADRFALAERLGLMPPQILGLQSSQVLSVVAFSATHTLICRRVGVCYSLFPAATDADYDTARLALLQVIANSLAPYPDDFSAELLLDGVRHPSQAAIYNRRLIVCSNGDATTPSSIHTYQIAEA
ncbi:MAG: hypothetical protein ACOYL5_11115 [Phototrophicaceae bacterium]